MEFTPFAKMARLNREVVVTEKIDGTNASILIQQAIKMSEGHADWPYKPEPEAITYFYGPDGSCWNVFAGSRNRWVTPEKDNYGFAKWVLTNIEDLKELGPGHHFGEWWGQGIQRGYGMDRKVFSLFNTGKWNMVNKPACCSVVPVLYQGLMEDMDVIGILEALKYDGSQAAYRFMDPEGICIFHTAANMYFKKTIKHDESPKGLLRT